MSESGGKRAGAKPPPDLDRLAWSVAEEGDPRTRAAFAARHPEWADELERRVVVVAERRDAGRSTGFAVAAPLTSRRERRPLPLSAALMGGLAVGGTVLALALLLSPLRRTEPALSELPIPNRTSVAGTSPERLRVTAAATAEDSPSAENASPSSGPIPPTSPTPNPLPAQDGSEAPTTIRFRRTSLHAALGLIGEAGGLRLRIDPAIPDPEVEEDLVDLTPREMIATLGGRYGFRVVPEGPRSLFLVPLAEEGEAPTDSGGVGAAPDLPPSIGGTERRTEGGGSRDENR